MLEKIIKDIKYRLDESTLTAEVIEKKDYYSGNIVIPDVVVNKKISYKVTSIGDDAFYGCDSLASLTIPNSVTCIGRCAFYNCSSLTSIIIPNSVTSIRDDAFCGCSSLTSLTIPDNVINIGKGAFRDCSSIATIAVDMNNTIYDSREECNAIIETATNTLICGCQNTNIPHSVTSIGERAFDCCKSLTSIIIPNSVASIGDYALRYCSSLTAITIPDSVTSIGNYAFECCKKEVRFVLLLNFQQILV